MSLREPNYPVSKNLIGLDKVENLNSYELSNISYDLWFNRMNNPYIGGNQNLTLPQNISCNGAIYKYPTLFKITNVANYYIKSHVLFGGLFIDLVISHGTGPQGTQPQFEYKLSDSTTIFNIDYNDVSKQIYINDNTLTGSTVDIYLSPIVIIGAEIDFSTLSICIDNNGNGQIL